MTVTYSRQGDAARIVLDDPDRRNALSFSTLDAIVRSVRRAEDGGATCIVLSSEGPVFSAGADFNDLTGTSADVHFDEAVARTTAVLRRTHLPVVATVQGPCLGAAVDLVAATDLLIATPDARFEVPALRLGILYNPEALSIIRERVSGAMLRRLMFGLSVSAADAAIGGLVTQVVAPSELDEVVQEIAARLAGAHRGALSATKELLNALDEGPFRADQWQALRLLLLDSPERHDAIARRQRRTPI